jgi:hypothetical protein
MKKIRGLGFFFMALFSILTSCVFWCDELAKLNKKRNQNKVIPFSSTKIIIIKTGRNFVQVEN